MNNDYILKKDDEQNLHRYVQYYNRDLNNMSINTNTNNDYSDDETIVEKNKNKDRIQTLILKWRKHVKEMAEIHEEAGYRIKKEHNLIGMAVIIVPFIMTVMQGIIDVSEIDDFVRKMEVTNSVMFGIITLLNGIYNWLDLGNQYSMHFQYSARYYELLVKIDQELTYQKIPTSIFLTEIRIRIDNLNLTSPDMPVNYCC